MKGFYPLPTEEGIRAQTGHLNRQFQPAWLPHTLNKRGGNPFANRRCAPWIWSLSGEGTFPGPTTFTRLQKLSELCGVGRQSAAPARVKGETQKSKPE